MHALLLSPAGWPRLDPQTQGFLRSAYGFLMLGMLAIALPHARRFFMSERWGGYARSSRGVDALQNPVALPLTYAVWLASNVLLVVDRWPVWAALANVLICREFFIRLRWNGLLRGMGAPGFIAYWTGGAVFLLELTTRYAGSVRPLALLAIQVDLAFIFLSAGLYKLRAGYKANYGVDLGLVNPQWGYWWRRYRGLRPDHPLFRALNQLGWITEIVAAVLILVPQTRFLGGAILTLVFGLIASQIRLGLLCEMVVLDACFTFSPGSAGARLLHAGFGWLPAAPTPHSSSHALVLALTVALWGYLALLPVAHLGLSANLYFQRALPPPLQRGLELYANAFGLIVWRVFSVDVVRFYVRIHRAPREDHARRTLVSRWGWRHGLRYAQVAEAIAVTTLFTTLTYHPSNRALFVERVLRYARTVPHRSDELLVFEYVAVEKGAEGWAFVSGVEFDVDVEAGTVVERVLDPDVSPRRPHPVSPAYEGVRPGSYAPASR